MTDQAEDLRFAAGALRDFTAAALRSVGVSDEHARTTAHSLVEANVRGVDTHGIARLPVYLQRLEAGLVSVDPDVRLVVDEPTTVVIDGDAGLGQVVCDIALRHAIERAQANGVCWVGVRNSTHNGTQAYWALKGARAGLLTWGFTNGEAIVAPWGGVERFLSTNPICVAVPSQPPDELVLDMATSNVAGGHLLLAASKGEAIPRGWALDAAGNDTTDPLDYLERGGTLIPLGGYKGAGLSLIVDVLAGILSGAASTTEVGSMYWHHDRAQNVGHAFFALDVRRLMPLEEFTQQVARTLRAMRAVRRSPGVEQIFAPGDIERAKAAERTVSGCPLTTDVVESLTKLGLEKGVVFPDPAVG